MTRELVPVSTAVAVPDARADVVGTASMIDGELVVCLRSSRVRDVTTRPVHRHYRGCECRIGALGYLGPISPADRARFHAVVTRWEARQARPWWRRWLP